MDIKHMSGEGLPDEERLFPVGERSRVNNESVDEILRDIMKEDGTFNDDFNELFSRYLGGSADDLRVTDLSDRTQDEPIGSRVEFSEETGRAFREEKNTERRISEKLSPQVREIYSEAVYSSAQPEFTNEGTVKYPSMGVGESEERVVYDAEWEERAKKEAQRREQIRRENMLRGDSAYGRSFRFSGADERSPKPYVNNAYIDPQDDSQDVPLFQRRQPVNQTSQPRHAAHGRQVVQPRQQTVPQKEEASEQEETEKSSFFRRVFPKSK